VTAAGRLPLPSWIAVEPVTEWQAVSRPHNWRAPTSAALAIVAVLCLLLGNVALWMRQDVYSARHIDAEAQQIVGSTNVQAAIANLLAADVVQPVLGQTGINSRGPIGAPLSSAARGLIQQALATQPVQRVAARLVEEVVPELEHGSGPITLSARQLAWIASPTLAGNRVVATVLDAAGGAGCCRVVLASRHGLSFAWRHQRQIRAAGIVLPALFVASLTLALVISRRRRLLAVILAASTAVIGLGMVALLGIGPAWWTGLFSRTGAAAGVVRAADRSVFGTATASLRAQSVLVAAAGVAALAVLAGTRRLTRRLTRPVTRQVAGA
jgi:hypothetical protein